MAVQDQLFDAETGLAALRAIAEQTRLRILFLLRTSELTVKDLTRVLGQSQPRISRHLKLLHEARLIERYREGSWVYFRLAEMGVGEALVHEVMASFDGQDVVFRLDQERLAALVAERSAIANAFFERNAGDWDRLRSLHVDEAEVEAAVLATFGGARVDLLVDLGTGTGRMLELLRDCYRRAIGIDANQAMLTYARSRLSGFSSASVQVRQGDLYQLSLDDEVAETVIMHQVLHHLNDPLGGLNEAFRILLPGGRLVVVDFAPHSLDFLREEYAHQRLGFSEAQMAQWLDEAGLDLASVRHLEPANDDPAKLTVSMWVASKPQTIARSVDNVKTRELEPLR